mgnify:CR=1 FL=1
MSACSSASVPPGHGDLLYCSCQLLARLLGEQVSALESGMPAGNLRLPERAAGQGGIAALKRLQAHWAHPPHRQHSRRHNNFRAQVCVGLNELWRLLEHGEAPEGTGAGLPHMTEWMVLNESPAGYAVMHVAGEVEGLVPGSVIALRPAPDKSWSICVVRWMKSENPEHIELGLELVAPAARSVQLMSVSYTHLRAHETVLDLVCRLLLEKTKKIKKKEQHMILSETIMHTRHSYTASEQ